MKQDDELPSLEKLQAQIDKVKGEKKDEKKSTSRTDMSQAMRLSIDLAAGVIVGVGAGYFLDRWLGTLPLFMIVGLFIGMAAGVKNMMRSAEIIDKKLAESEKEELESDVKKLR